MSNPLRTMTDAKEVLLSILPTLASNGGVANHGAEARYQLRVMSLLIDMCGLKMNQVDVESKFKLNGGLDVALYSDAFVGDFNARNNSAEMVKNVRMLIEIKSVLVNGLNTNPSKSNTRLSSGTIVKDIEKLIDTRKFLAEQGTNVATALMVFDTTEHNNLRLTQKSLSTIIEKSEAARVDFFYFTSDKLTPYFNDPDHRNAA